MIPTSLNDSTAHFPSDRQLFLSYQMVACGDGKKTEHRQGQCIGKPVARSLPYTSPTLAV